jgi:PAS domain S-box-containing protein
MGQPLPILISPSETFDPEILQAAIEASPEGMALAEDGRIAYANRAFARLVGHRPRAELRGRALASLRPPGHPCALTRADGARNTPDNHLCQFVTQGKNGVPSRIESTCSAFRARAASSCWLPFATSVSASADAWCETATVASGPSSMEPPWGSCSAICRGGCRAHAGLLPSGIARHAFPRFHAPRRRGK